METHRPFLSPPLSPSLRAIYGCAPRTETIPILKSHAGGAATGGAEVGCPSLFIKSSAAQALIGYADSHTPVWLSLVNAIKYYVPREPITCIERIKTPLDMVKCLNEYKLRDEGIKFSDNYLKTKDKKNLIYV